MVEFRSLATMSDSGEKRHGFERWVASLKLESLKRPPAGGDDSLADPDEADEQATLVKRLPKEVIYRLRERESNRAPQSDDSTAIFVPPPDLLVRAKRLDAPPKPSASVAPEPPPAFEEPTQILKSDPQAASSQRFRTPEPPRGASAVEEEPTRIHSSAEPDVAAELAAIDRLTSQPPVPPGSPGASDHPPWQNQKTPIAAFSAFDVPSLETPSDAPPPREPKLAPSVPPTSSGAGWVAFAVALLVLAVLLVAVAR